MIDKIVFFISVIIFSIILLLTFILLLKLNNAMKKDLKKAEKEINDYLDKSSKLNEVKEINAKEKEKFRDNSIDSANASVEFLHNLSKRNKEK